MNPTLYMMFGLPASSKSTYAKYLSSILPIVSSDEIRKELFGSEEDQSHNQKVFEEVHRRINQMLKDGISCIYDATNLNRKRRKSFLKTIPKGTKKVIIVMATDIDIVLKQNSERIRKVPEDVIMKMYRRMSFPRKDEGWDEIKIVTHDDNSKTLHDYLRETIGFDQDNHHHTLLLHQHLSTAADYIDEHKDEYGLSEVEARLAWFAALSHDIGKPICKTYETWSGKITRDAHYYNHAEIGAYLIACAMDNFAIKDIDLKYLLILVQWHMDLYDNKNWKEKFKELYGDRMAEIMELVNKADRNAH